MQSYEHLVKKYNLIAFGSITAYHHRFTFPVARLLSPIDLLAFTNKLLIPQKWTLGVLNRLFIDSQYLIGLEERLKGFDIVHVAETYYHFTNQCIKAKKRGYIKKIVSTVWENIPFSNEGIWGRREFKKDAFKYIDIFLPVSQKARQALLKEGCPKEKIIIMPPGVDTNKFKPNTKKDDKKVIILFVGRIEEYKGIYDSISAASLLLKDEDLKNYKLQFKFIGEGSKKSRMLEMEKKLGLEKAVIHEVHSYEDMPSIYQSADIFIAPSMKTPTWEEQFSMAILEAQSSGLPIISTSTGSIKDNLARSGVIIEEGKPVSLALSLKQLIIDKELRLKLGKKARKRAVKYFDSHIIAHKIDSVYQKLLS